MAIGRWKNLRGKSRNFIPFSWTRMVVWRSWDWENGLIFSHVARIVDDSLWLVAIILWGNTCLYIVVNSGKWLHTCTALIGSGTIDKYGMVHHRFQIMVDTCKDVKPWQGIVKIMVIIGCQGIYFCFTCLAVSENGGNTPPKRKRTRFRNFRTCWNYYYESWLL